MPWPPGRSPSPRAYAPSVQIAGAGGGDRTNQWTLHKLLVIDGKVGSTGGVGISKLDFAEMEELESGRDKREAIR